MLVRRHDTVHLFHVIVLRVGRHCVQVTVLLFSISIRETRRCLHLRCYRETDKILRLLIFIVLYKKKN